MKELRLDDPRNIFHQKQLNEDVVESGSRIERWWPNPSVTSAVVVAVVAIVGIVTAYILTERTGEAIVGAGALLTIGTSVLSLYNQRAKRFESAIVGGLWATIASLVIFVIYSLVMYIAITFGFNIHISTILSVIVVLSLEEGARIFISVYADRRIGDSLLHF